MENIGRESNDSINVQNERENIFLVAGRTGGPIVPLIAVAKNLDYTPIILGVKRGVETDLAQTNNFKIEYLPEAKFSLGSFKREKMWERIKGIFSLFKMFIKLVYSFILSLFIILKYKPKAIFSAGSFLAVPVIYASRLLRLFGVKTKIITHQQDPLPGLANKLTFKFADYKTCVFEYSRKFKQFKDAKIIPNPIDTQRFNENKLNGVMKNLEKTDLELANFLKSYSKPTLLIMGGGSGSEFLNNWTLKNLDTLTLCFKIIHLTGGLNKLKNQYNFKDYLARSFLKEEYPLVLKKADIVLARPGLGTITELMFLNKPAALVPIPYSHQEQNVEEVKGVFTILKQNENTENWYKIIKQIFEEGWVGDKIQIEEDLQKYYNEIKSIIAK